MAHLEIKLSAEIAELGNSQTQQKILACHGYGQLAGYFIKHFTALSKTHHIVAPQAPHLFYLNGFSGRVGASWMTSHHREQSIKDNINYLKQVADSYCFVNHPFHAVGFSQGTETLCRWLATSPILPKKLILWGNAVPEDLPKNIQQHWERLNLYIVVGTKDEFLTPERWNNKLALLKKYQLNYELITYDGEHRIMPDLLAEIIEK